MEGREQYYFKGSMTIEVTLIMPIIIGIIVIFSYVWLFLYNSYLLEQTIERAMIDYEKEWELTDEEIKVKLEEQIEGELQRRLLALRSYYVSTNVSMFRIEVTGSYTMNVSLASVFEEFLGRPTFTKEYQGSILRENSITLIRIYKKLQEIL